MKYINVQNNNIYKEKSQKCQMSKNLRHDYYINYNHNYNFSHFLLFLLKKIVSFIMRFILHTYLYICIYFMRCSFNFYKKTQMHLSVYKFFF